MDKLSIGYEMARFDAKDRGFFDDLNDDEKKKFTPFLMIRWSASVMGSSDLQGYQIIAANERLNKNFFDISAKEHKKFQWLLATTVSPGLGKQRYQWLAAKKKDTSNNKVEKFLREVYPQLKDDEIKLLARINAIDDIKNLARQHGFDEARIRKEL